MTAGNWISAFAPATVGNVGPGFDCFGFAVDGVGDTVSVRRSETPGIQITIEDGDDLPLAPERNTASVAAQCILDHHRNALGDGGLQMRIAKGIPSCSGLGGSAASAVGGAEAAMQFVCDVAGVDRDEDLVLEAALTGEAIASGGRHADNVAPCALGGFTIVLSVEPLSIKRLLPAVPVWVSLVTPAIRIATADARAVLPKHVPLQDAIANWSHTAALVAGFMDGDFDAIGASLHDQVVEPHRARLVDGYDAARAAALAAGAAGVALSGSGPTMFALSPTEDLARTVTTAMHGVFVNNGLSCRQHVSQLSPLGVRRL